MPFVEGEDDLFAGLGGAAGADALATQGALRVAYDGRTAVESLEAEPQESGS